VYFFRFFGDDNVFFPVFSFSLLWDGTVREFSRSFIGKMTDLLTKRLEDYGNDSNTLLMTFKDCEIVLQLFLQFGALLRLRCKSYEDIQHKNQLAFYIQVFNILALDYEFIYYGSISSLPFHQLISKSSLFKDESNGEMKFKCYNYLEKEWKALSKRNMSKEDRIEYGNTSLEIENLGRNVGECFFARLRKELKSMEDTYCNSVVKSGNQNINIVSIRVSSKVLKVSASSIPNTWTNRHKIIQALNQKLGVVSNAVTDDIGKVSSSSAVNIFKTSTVQPSKEHQKLGVSNTVTDVVGVLSSNTISNGIKSSSNQTDKAGSINNTSTIVAVRSSDGNLSSTDSLYDKDHSFETSIVARNTTGNDSSVAQELSTNDDDDNTFKYTTILANFNKEFRSNMIRSFEKERSQIQTAVNLVLSSVHENMVFHDVYNDLEAQSLIIFNSLEEKIKSEKRRLTNIYIKELHDTLHHIVEFCKALISGNVESVQRYLFRYDEDEMNSIMVQSNVFVDYITREDELLVSFHKEKLFNQKTNLLAWITSNPTSFSTKELAHESLISLKLSSSTVDRCSFAIAAATQVYLSDENPFKYAEKKRVVDSDELTDLMENQLVIVGKKAKSKDSKAMYSGVKLNADGSGNAISKKRKIHSELPTNELEKALQSLNKKQKLEKPKKQIAVKVDDDVDVEDDEEEEEDEDGSVPSALLFGENEGEDDNNDNEENEDDTDENKGDEDNNDDENEDIVQNIKNMPPLQERLLINFQNHKLPNKVILESYMQPLLKVFDIAEIQEALRELVKYNATFHQSTFTSDHQSTFTSDNKAADITENAFEASEIILSSPPHVNITPVATTEISINMEMLSSSIQTSSPESSPPQHIALEDARMDVTNSSQQDQEPSTTQVATTTEISTDLEIIVSSSFQTLSAESSSSHHVAECDEMDVTNSRQHQQQPSSLHKEVNLASTFDIPETSSSLATTTLQQHLSLQATSKSGKQFEFDNPIPCKDPLRLLMDSMVPLMITSNNTIKNPVFKVFKEPSEIISNSHPTYIHLDRLSQSSNAPKLNAVIVCVMNMFIYAIRELLFLLPLKGSFIHRKFFDIVRSWTSQGRNIETFHFKVESMWTSQLFKNHFCPTDCQNVSFHEVISRSFLKYYDFLNMNKPRNEHIFLNYIPNIPLSAQCDTTQFHDCIQKAFNLSRRSQLDENILFVSFDSFPVKKLPIPYTIRLSYEGKIVVYQTASICFKNSTNECVTTIFAKSSNAEWFRFGWERVNDVLAKFTLPIDDDLNPSCFPFKYEGSIYRLEGIIFVRSWDQMSSFENDVCTELQPAIVSHFEGFQLADVSSEDIKSIRVQSAMVTDRIVSNVLLRLHAFFFCPSVIYVEENSQGLLDGILLHACGKTVDTKQEMDEFVMLNSYDDLNVWKTTYDRIDENLTISRNLEHFFEPSVPKFLFYPINVHNNTHWILLIVSTGQKCMFIIDSNEPTGNKTDVYIVAIFIKYCEYKASISNGAFIFVSADWRIVSLPATKQQDGVNCGIHLIINAAMIMRQIKNNERVEISFVEDPMPVYAKASKALKDKVNKVRTTLYNMFLYRDNFENVMSSIFAVDSVPNPAIPPKSPKKAKDTKNDRSKVVFLG